MILLSSSVLDCRESGMRHPRAQGARQPRRLGAVRTGFGAGGRVGTFEPVGGYVVQNLMRRQDCIAYRQGINRRTARLRRLKGADRKQRAILAILLVCSSGQHGMAPEIDGKSAVPTADVLIAAEGATHGAAASPTDREGRD